MVADARNQLSLLLQGLARVQRALFFCPMVFSCAALLWNRRSTANQKPGGSNETAAGLGLTEIRILRQSVRINPLVVGNFDDLEAVGGADAPEHAVDMVLDGLLGDF